MQDAELLRYSRHILLDEIGIEGQAKISSSSALIIGAGGLGSPVAMYLASSGIGHLTLVDPDVVDLTNLQRQIAHHTGSVGRPKVESVADTIWAINPNVQVSVCQQRADLDFLSQKVPNHDLVLDCSDNFLTRHAVNAACVLHRKPLISGAAIRFDGQISVIDPTIADFACYACVFPSSLNYSEVQCSAMGVFAPIVGIIGAMQAAEALKVLLNVGHSLSGRLLMLDGKAMDWTTLLVNRNPNCPICSRASHLR